MAEQLATSRPSAVVEEIAESLLAAERWTKLLARLGWLTVALSTGLALFFLSVAFIFGGGVEHRVASYVALNMGILFVIPSTYLTRLKNATTRYREQGLEIDLAEGLEQERKLWKFTGFATLFSTLITLLVILIQWVGR